MKKVFVSNLHDCLLLDYLFLLLAMFSVDSGFIKADSGNLPEVDMFMVFDYFNKNKDFISAEMRGIKLLR